MVECARDLGLRAVGLDAFEYLRDASTSEGRVALPPVALAADDPMTPWDFRRSPRFNCVPGLGFSRIEARPSPTKARGSAEVNSKNPRGVATPNRGILAAR